MPRNNGVSVVVGSGVLVPGGDSDGGLGDGTGGEIGGGSELDTEMEY